jgi:hypothetical protein
MNANVKDLPAVLRTLVKSAATVRKVIVLNVGRAQAITDGAIIATLGGRLVDGVPYADGGGQRTQAAAYVVKFYGGGVGVFVVRPEGFGYSWDPMSLNVACDMHLERGEAA